MFLLNITWNSLYFWGIEKKIFENQFKANFLSKEQLFSYPKWKILVNLKPHKTDYTGHGTWEQ